MAQLREGGARVGPDKDLGLREPALGEKDGRKDNQ